jgi:prevent-host-death family protein
MKAVVSLEEFRKNLSDIVARVMYGEQTVLVQKHKRAGVVVMSEQEYEKLRDPRKRFQTEADWQAFFTHAEEIRARMSEAEQAEIEQIVDQEVRAVRNERKQPQA